MKMFIVARVRVRLEKREPSPTWLEKVLINRARAWGIEQASFTEMSGGELQLVRCESERPVSLSSTSAVEQGGDPSAFYLLVNSILHYDLCGCIS